MDSDVELNIRPSLQQVTKQLRKQSLSLKNRLQSILHDAKFVQSLNLPVVVPNERCGLWYVPGPQRTDSAYFKSTDGHMNEWAFSLRRLNLHLLPLLAKHGEVAIVDSTRRGKLMPDALLKTIPMWCAVVSAVCGHKTTLELFTPPEMVSQSEHNEMAKRLFRFVDEAERLGAFDDVVLDKPIVPVWVYPGKKPQIPDQSSFEAYHVFCVTASKKDPGHTSTTVGFGSTATSWKYVQGAADDHELWLPDDLCGGRLDANMFWKLVESESSRLIDLQTGYLYDWLTDEQLVVRMNEVYGALETKTDQKTSVSDITAIKNQSQDTGISLGVIKQALAVLSLQRRYRYVIVLSEKDVECDDEAVTVQHHRLESSKKGAKLLRTKLPQIMDLLEPSASNRVLIVCDTGTDLGAGVAIALLCKHFDDDWAKKDILFVDKDTVRRHSAALSKLCRINPSRNTLQSINSYLMAATGTAYT